MAADLRPTKAFVIGPIGDRDAPIASESRKIYEEAVEVLREIIRPACISHGIEAVRADEIHEMGEIPEQVIRMLRDTPIVIADVTRANANVMYELGIRHTTGKLTIPIGQKGQLPFDVSTIRTILFVRTPEGLIDARDRLVKAIDVGLTGRGNPVTATRVWFEDSASRSASLESEKSLRREAKQSEIERLFIADISENIQSVAQALTSGTAITTDMNSVFSVVINDLSALRAAGQSPNIPEFADRLAGGLRDPAIRLQIVAGDFLQTVARLESNVSFLLKRIHQTPATPAVRALLNATVEGIRKMASAAAGSTKQTVAFREVIQTFSGLGGSIAPVVTQLVDVLDSLVATFRRLNTLEKSLAAIE